MTKEYNNSVGSSSAQFDIRNYVDFDDKGRAVCPNCGDPNKPNKKTLSVILNGSSEGAYKCFKCNDTEAIRSALGEPKNKIIPTALAKPVSQPKDYRVNLKTIEKDCSNLVEAQTETAFLALKWLKERGITAEAARQYKLGLVRAKYGEKFYPAISIPLEQDGKYHRKKRLIPWDKTSEVQQERPWSQYGIPATVFFTHNPHTATETWLVEGEWDAIYLGHLLAKADIDYVSVATFTTGAGNLPKETDLVRLPGRVKIFYDRNDKPHEKTGKRSGDEGAKKVAIALKGRGLISQVPMPSNPKKWGWDVSDALNFGYTVEDFQNAALEAKPYLEPQPTSDASNPLRQYMTSYWDIMQNAPDFVDWLVYEILSPNELLVLAAPPRAGKSLLALALAKAVASGGTFLDRPVKQGKVLYINIEDSSGKVKRRLIAQEWTEAEAKNVTELNRFSLDQIEALEELIREESYSLVVIDTLSRVRRDGYSENSSDMANALAPLQDIAAENNCCILVVHHTRKQGLETKATDDVFDSVRGSGAIRATCRGMLVLVKAKNNYRLVIENGETEGQDLAIRLNPSTLVWTLLGKWSLNVNLTQKERVIEYLKTVEAATIKEIEENTLIPQSSIYKVIKRLILEGAIGEKSSTDSKTTNLYYSTEVVLTSQILVRHSNVDRESNTAKSDKSTFQISDKVKSDQRNLPNDHFYLSDSQNVDLSDRGKNEGQSHIYQENFESDNFLTSQTNSTYSPIKVTKGKKSLSDSHDHFGDVTKNFTEKVIKSDNDSTFEVGEKVTGNCTNTKIDDWVGTIKSVNENTALVEWSDGSINLIEKFRLKKYPC